VKNNFEIVFAPGQTSDPSVPNIQRLLPSIKKDAMTVGELFEIRDCGGCSIDEVRFM